MRALAAEPPDPRRPVVVARHADGSRNPVRLEPEAAPLVEAASGDRGLGPLIDAHPELTRVIEVEGANPDVDTPADLVDILAADWARRVRDNAAQVDRFRETPDGRDFYATVSRTFVADPARDGDLVLEALLGLARPDDTWLDIGAGAGRYALPLARRVRRVVAVDPSARCSRPSARGWRPTASPTSRPSRAAGRPTTRSERPSARTRSPTSSSSPTSATTSRTSCPSSTPWRPPPGGPAWPSSWSATPRRSRRRSGHPSTARNGSRCRPCRSSSSLLEARRTRPDVTRLTGERRQWGDLDELLANLRRQLWTAPGSAADARLLAAVGDLAVVDPDGSVSLPGTPPLDIGIVVWAPNAP